MFGPDMADCLSAVAAFVVPRTEEMIPPGFCAKSPSEYSRPRATGPSRTEAGEGWVHLRPSSMICSLCVSFVDIR